MFGKKVPSAKSIWRSATRYIWGPKMSCARNIGCRAEMRLSGEAKTPRCTDFALEVIENKQFLSKLFLRDVHIAPSWGQGGNVRWQPHSARGRQEKWYKDFWLSHSLHLWRSWAFRAVKTVLRCRSHLTQPQHKRSWLTAALTSRPFLGRAFGSVRHPLSMAEVAHG